MRNDEIINVYFLSSFLNTIHNKELRRIKYNAHQSYTYSYACIYIYCDVSLFEFRSELTK